MIQSFRNINSISALNKVLEIRKYKIKEDYSHLASLDDVKAVAKEMLESISVDILNSNKQLSPEDISRSEKYLERALNNSFVKKYSESFLSDEIALLGSTLDYGLMDFRSIDFSNAAISLSVKAAMKALGFIAPSIPLIIKDAYRVQTFAELENQFLCASRITVNSKGYIALFDVFYGPELKVESPSDYVDLSINNISYIGHTPRLHVNSCFVFGLDSHSLSPARLFLRAIAKYGKEMTINNVTQKFFLEIISSELAIRKGNKIIYAKNLVSNSDYEPIMTLRKQGGTEIYNHIYTISPLEIAGDLKRRQMI